MELDSQNMVARIEEAETDAFLTLYRAAVEHGTGWHDEDGIMAVWSRRDEDPGYSCVINLIDARDPAATLERVEHAARDAGAHVLGVDAPPDVLEQVGDATLRQGGFTPAYQECMWGRVVDAAPAPPELGQGVAIERVTDAERDRFARTLNVGYGLPPAHARGSIFASTIGHPGWTHYLVTFEGTPGAASVLYVTARVAQLFVATTVPSFRGRGAQTALIRQRLADALAAGCDLATSQTVIDNASPRNMARHGFQPLYHRWIYGKRIAG